MTKRQKLILFLISCDPGIRDIYRMIKLFDRADFPSKMTDNLKPLLEEGLICIAKTFDDGTPSAYEITGKGKVYLDKHLDQSEIIEHIKNMQNPELLLKITITYLERKNGIRD